MIPSRKNTILYLTLPKPLEDEFATRRVIATLKQAGYTTIEYRATDFIPTILQLIRRMPRVQYLYLSMDLSGTLCKYSLIKLLFPHILILWDLQGFEEEKCNGKKFRTRLRVAMIQAKRRAYSLFTNGYCSSSMDCLVFAGRTLAKRPSVVLPTYAYLRPATTVTLSAATARWTTNLFSDRKFIVVILGDPQHDLFASYAVEKLAQWVYKRDASIRFILFGEHPKHPLGWFKNIIFINPLPSRVYDYIIRLSHASLTLYHMPEWCPLSIQHIYTDVCVQQSPIFASSSIWNQLPSFSKHIRLVDLNRPNAIGERILTLHKAEKKMHVQNASSAIPTMKKQKILLIHVYKKFLNQLYEAAR